MKHNTAIIEALIAFSLIFTLIMAVRGFLTAKEPEATESLAGLGDLEGTLKKILAQASQVSAGPSTETSQKLVDEIEALKLNLQEKQKQIEEMKSANAASGAVPGSEISDGEKAKIEGQLKELQAKLSEYEIISEDIADLSLYKEQNAKLQQEVAALKQNQGAPVSASAEPSVVAAEEPAVASAPVAAEEPAPAPPPASPPPPEPAAEVAAAAAIEHVVDDDLMAAFGAAVEKQQSGVTSLATASDPVDLGSMDVDKMMEEAVSIKTDVPEVDVEQALGTGVDEAKILQEAAALSGTTSEEPISQEDKKLMGQFEDFVKKGE